MTPAPGKPSAWAGPYLTVQGEPFVVVGAEVHNSSSSSLPAITQAFDVVQRLGANTVLAPVAWDLFEPVEGRYDPTLIDAMITHAHTRGLRLIPLWFGTWKNGASTYVPAWVKRDPDRFPRSRLADGAPATQLTPFSDETRSADARAFTALMSRIREVDTAGTVIAVQVQNEVGLLGATRDHSTLANATFTAPVPGDVLQAVRNDTSMPLHAEWIANGAVEEGAWAETFPPGDRADEAFMAAGYASYVEAVAAAGRAAHDVPLFVNAWLDQDSVLDGPVAVAGGKRPGDYPSGGPVLPVASIWEALAPSLDLIAVDAYVADADDVFAGFAARRGRLLVPELRADEAGIGQMFLALGKHRAAGVSPFGVDALRDTDPEAAALTDAFRLLRTAGALITEHPGAATTGFILGEGHPHHSVLLGEVTVDITHAPTAREPVRAGYGLTITDGNGGLYIVGRGFLVSLSTPTGREASFTAVSMLDVEEGQLTVAQQLNGDETASGTLIPFPHADADLLPGRVIPTRAPDTGIVRLEVFTY